MNEKISEITTIKALIKTLNEVSSGSSYLNVMRAININIRNFEEFLSWNDQHYTRNCLAQTEAYELLLICWEKGQKSAIHDYDAKEAWIHPVLGRIKEERFRINSENNKLEKVSSVILGTNEFSFIDCNSGIHRYSNDYEARSISLHLYCAPVKEWNIYDETTGNTSKLPLKYDQNLALENC